MRAIGQLKVLFCPLSGICLASAWIYLRMDDATLDVFLAFLYLWMDDATLDALSTFDHLSIIYLPLTISLPWMLDLSPMYR